MVLRLLLSAAVSLVSIAGADAIESFRAVCEDKAGHAFRTATDLAGKPMPDEWNTNEKFLDEIFEEFDYRQGQRFVHLRRTKKKAHRIFESSNTIIFVEATDTIGAGSVWSYAINTKLQKAVAAQVNAFDVFGTGLKGRLVELDCKFEMPPP